ncbi:chitin synthase chs-1-like [Mya arenaria]|uniref:chitin synthase chs-1-like n=1 Tax=Mya arenaria TaxID=6604 RepID=UPI0022E1CF5A|nr:chitin synthase chs-1-like [Mya arenaria]
MPSKIKDVYQKKKDYRHRPSKKAVLIKWISTLLLFVLILGFINFSKISVISITNRMYHAEKNGHAPGMFIMLQLMAVIPQVINFMRGIMRGAFRKDIPWPSKRSLTVATVVCLLESVGITLFIFKIPGITKPVVVVLLMMCVFIAPIIYNLVISFLLGRDGLARDRIIFVMALVFEIGGCGLTASQCALDTTERTFAIVALLLLVAAQILSTGYLIIRSQSVVMLKEDQLFWTPMYNSALLEQWLMLVRKNEYHDEDHQNPIEKAKQSKIFICTTMYREADYEMKQLLESIQRLNLAQAKGNRHFEAHVFFDGAVKDRNPTEFVLQLVSLAETVLGVEAEFSTKNATPYGISFSWKLKAADSGKGMVFRIHLKDNLKVKNKKRWSQVMYMSYVLDFLLKQDENGKREASEEDCFVLTTDADVQFTPDSVEALLDLMTRDNTVGAVCARTHPLGSGPLVWYQVFEYAIGHWFQKAAEHVIGSVLCSPGCFSVYRCRAIRDILPQYATNVEHAFDFLTKDMGEDRWFCTLLVQSGWLIEYCAASENSTHCPEDFDEFFKQRRRWVASTLANLMLLIKEWSIISKLNPRVSIIFLVYQMIILSATLISPSSVILVVTGGLKYSWNIGVTTSVVLQVLVTVGYAATCLFTSSKTQLNVAKLLTFLYAVIMSAVMVGAAVQIAKDFSKDSDTVINKASFPISITTLYLGIMVGIFFITGILHLWEFVYLLHGVWFFLCIPAGYLVLMIYSISNITDRSWGTREVKTHSVREVNKSWQDSLTKAFKSFFFCCFKKQLTSATSSTQTELPQTKTTTMRTMSLGRQTTTQESQSMVDEEQPTSLKISDFRKSVRFDMGIVGDLNEETNVAGNLNAVFDDNSDDEEGTENKVRTVEEWLPKESRDTPGQHELVKRFKEHGFENTIFISRMTEKELKDVGVKSAGLKSFFMENIKRLPDYEIQAFVPKTVDEWLDNIGLGIYKENFKKEQIRIAKDMEVLKSFSRSDIERDLNIKKIGHIKRLLYAISKLRNPTEAEMKLIEVGERLNKPVQVKLSNKDGFEFWDNLRNFCLIPQSTAYGLEKDLKEKLGDLRNAWLMVFAVSNALWMVLIFTLANQGQLLSVAGSNPAGLVVLVLFSFVLLIQFLAMILHRIGTLTHFLGRAPYRMSGEFNMSWAFNDSDIKVHEDETTTV